MSKETALDKYTQAVGQMESHIELNKSVFDQHQQLVFRVMDAENELRDAVAIAGAGVSDGIHSVTITPQTQTYADIETLNASHGKLLTDELLKNIIKTQARPARISISKVRQPKV